MEESRRKRGRSDHLGRDGKSGAMVFVWHLGDSHGELFQQYTHQLSPPCVRFLRGADVFSGSLI